MADDHVKLYFMPGCHETLISITNFLDAFARCYSAAKASPNDPVPVTIRLKFQDSKVAVLKISRQACSSSNFKVSAAAGEFGRDVADLLFDGAVERGLRDGEIGRCMQGMLRDAVGMLVDEKIAYENSNDKGYLKSGQVTTMEEIWSGMYRDTRERWDEAGWVLAFYSKMGLRLAERQRDLEMSGVGNSDVGKENLEDPNIDDRVDSSEEMEQAETHSQATPRLASFDLQHSEQKSKELITNAPTSACSPEVGEAMVSVRIASFLDAYKNFGQGIDDKTVTLQATNAYGSANAALVYALRDYSLLHTDNTKSARAAGKRIADLIYESAEEREINPTSASELMSDMRRRQLKPLINAIVTKEEFDNSKNEGSGVEQGLRSEYWRVMYVMVFYAELDQRLSSRHEAAIAGKMIRMKKAMAKAARDSETQGETMGESGTN